VTSPLSTFRGGEAAKTNGPRRPDHASLRSEPVALAPFCGAGWTDEKPALRRCHVHRSFVARLPGAHNVSFPPPLQRSGQGGWSRRTESLSFQRGF